MKKHTTTEIRNKWTKLFDNPDIIYHDGRDLFNYSGKLKDYPEIPVMDFVAKLICEDITIFDRIGTNVGYLRQSKSFNKKDRGVSNAEARIKRFGGIGFNEKPFAVALYNSGHNFLFGKIFDYELSLKENNDSKYGEIDLLSAIKDEVYVIELKIGYSDSGQTKETLLRAIMESFTFTKLLSIRKDKFIKDMNLSEKIKLRPVVLTLTNAMCAEHMRMLTNGQLRYIKILIDEMNKYFNEKDILPFEFFAIDEDNPELIQDNNLRIVFKDSTFIRSNVIKYQ